jgi:ligand-binding sensor domain-containing protein
MNRKSILILTLFLSCLLNAQKSAKLINMGNSKLPDNEISSIAVDRSGNKWLGLANGQLVKYDGNTFINFTSNNSIIKGKNIGPLFVDSKDRLWFSTSNPNNLYMLKNDSIMVIENKIVQELKQITAIAENSKGELYFGGFNGLIKYDGKNWQKIKLPLKEAVVRTMDISSNNTISIGLNNGLLIGNEGKWEIFQEQKNKLQLDVVRGLKFTSNDKLIIGYGGGMGNGGFSIKSGVEWTHFNKSNSHVSDNMIRDIEVDEKGNYWMASNNGLIKLSAKGEIESILFRDGMYQNTIFDIAIENNTVWVATNFGVIEYHE